MPVSFRTGRPTRRPYPYDVEFAGVGMMLGHRDSKDGSELISTKPQDQANVVPTDYGYDAQSPLIEAVQAYTDLSLGFGLKIQSSKDDKAYYYALGVDCSIAGLTQKGPYLNTVSPLGSVDATNGVNRSFDLNGQTYFCDGRYAQVKTTAAYTMNVAQDFGSGQKITDVAVFQSNLPGGGTYAYLAMGDNCAIWRAGPKWAVQNVTITGTPSAGTYLLTYAGNSTVPIAYNANVGIVQTALQAVPGLTNITVSQIAGLSSVNATFAVSMNGISSPGTLVVTDSTTGGSHGIAVTTPTAYAAVNWMQRVTEQTITISATPTMGTYTLSYGTQTTAAINWNDSASTIQTRLQALTGLGSVIVTSVGDAPNLTHTIVFTGVNDQATLLTQTKTGLDGTWVLATSQNVLKARAWCMSGREFYRGHQVNNMAKVDTDADPFLEANWTAPNAFRVGDQSAGISRLVVSTQGTVVVLKTDGMWTLDQAGQDYQLFPFLRSGADPTNGEVVGQWIQDLYIAYGPATYKLGPSMTLAEIGTERLTENDSPVHGPITAMEGHDNYNLYAGIYNPDTGNSYLLKYGAWYIAGNFGQRAGYGYTDPNPKRIEAWHGSITQAFVGKKITLLKRTTVDGPSGHQLMHIGFSDGTVQSFVLPCVPNPLGCSNYQWTTADATLYYPTWHGLFQADPKALRAVTMTSTTLSTTNTAEYQYNLTPGSGSYASLGTFITNPRQKIEFGPNTGSVLVDQAVILHSTVNTSTPTLLGVALHQQLRTALYQIYEFYILADDNLVKRNGTPMRIGAKSIRNTVEAYAGAVDPVTKQQDVRSVGSFTLYLPDETAKQVAVIGYEQSMAWDWRTRKFRSALHVKCADVTFQTLIGSYSHLEPYTYGGLEAYTYLQLQSL